MPSQQAQHPGIGRAELLLAGEFGELGRGQSAELG
jgi:hypothetical protein